MITDYTDSQERANAYVASGSNILLTGKPGTGKTEYLKDIAERQGMHGKKVVLAASTGLAASNLDGGRTIHSILHWYPNAYGLDLDRCCDVIGEADILIIDEVSMLDTSIMRHISDCVHHLDHPPQIIMSGDFFQLPPVSKGAPRVYPFETPYWHSLNLVPCVLDDVVRQSDPEFKHQLELAMLADPACIKYFNSQTAQKEIDGAITLCTKNDDAKDINAIKMSILPGTSKTYTAKGEVNGANFSDSRVEKDFIVKKNMRVMALRNDSANRYQNGSLGTVVGIGEDTVTVMFDNGNRVDMERIPYEIETIDKKKMARIEQFPLRGGFAITIHKSQGQTFDSINIKAPRCWDPGQLYVALSRARSIRGIHLMEPMTQSNLITDPRVVNYYNNLLMGNAA